MKGMLENTLRWLHCTAPLILLLCTPPAARAAQLQACVSTAAELDQAMRSAKDVPVTIKIVQGDYNIAGTAFFDDTMFLSDGTELLGGYTSQCAGRSIALGNTRLYANSTGQIHPYANFKLEGLTFNPGLNVNQCACTTGEGAKIEIRRSAFIGNGTGSVILANSGYQSAQEVLIVDSIFAGAPDPAYCVLNPYNESSNFPQRITMINDTVINQGNAYGGVCLGGDSSGFLAIYNSILFGTTQPGHADLASNSPHLVLVNNIIGTHAHPTPDTAPVGSSNADPLLGANFRPSESPLSPAINTGTDAVPGGLPATDIDGRDRVIGSRVDRGAYESTVQDANLLTVTNTNDSGIGSLRSAIASANATAGYSVIKFDIGNECGPKVIALQSALPQITSSMRIDGYTQDAATPNTLMFGFDAQICVLIDGSAQSITNGIVVPNSAPAGASLTLRGVGLGGFSNSGVLLAGGSGHHIEGNRFGGANLTGSQYGVVIGAGASGVTLGGSDYAARNVILDSVDDGVRVFGQDHSVVNNQIGIGWNAATNTAIDRGNGAAGVHVFGSSNIVSDNIIGFNQGPGLLVSGDSNAIVRNGIGTYVLGTTRNLGDGVRIDGGNDNLLNNNGILENGGAGVRVGTGQRNEIRRNNIVANTGLGIDLATAGVTANDDDGASQPADYANRGQNFPTISKAIGSRLDANVGGAIITRPGVYVIDIYFSNACDASAHGEGNVWLGNQLITVPPPASGTQGVGYFDLQLDVQSLVYLGIANGEAITATATDTVGNTSEFSVCKPYTDDGLFINSFEL